MDVINPKTKTEDSSHRGVAGGVIIYSEYENGDNLCCESILVNSFSWPNPEL